MLRPTRQRETVRAQASVWLACLLLIAPVLCVGGVSQDAVTVYGGAGQTSGSLSIADVGGTRLMIDCGAFYPHGAGSPAVRQARTDQMNSELPREALSCDLLVWTHAHLDHIGRTPLLVRSGFRGTILATPGTAALAPVMLQMQVRWDEHWRRNWTWSEGQFRSRYGDATIKPHWHPDCPYSRKISPRNRASRTCTLREVREYLTTRTGRRIDVRPCKMCSELEAEEVMDLVKVVECERELPLAQNVRLELLDAGHIPGSASVLITMVRESDGYRVLFSGDLGNGLSRISPGPRAAPEADVLFVEATYGAECRGADVASEHRVFRGAVARTIAQGGVAWVPAFALDRTQKILFELRTAQSEGLLPAHVPVYCPSPSASAVTDEYETNRVQGWFSRRVELDAHAFRPDGLVERLPDAVPSPAVVVTTDGMMTSGYTERMAHLLMDPRNALFLVGYQDPYAAGGKLKSGARRVEIGEHVYDVRATVRSFSCFSAHGDAADIDRWLANQRPSSRIFLVHGDEDKLRERARDLGAAHIGTVDVAVSGQRIPLR